MAIDFLKNLKLDEYYMLFVYLGTFFFVFSLALPTQWLSNERLGLVSLGILFIGVGEWKNHKLVSGIKEANAYTGGPALVTIKIRKPDFLGYLFDFLGILFLFGGLISVFNN